MELHPYRPGEALRILGVWPTNIQMGVVPIKAAARGQNDRLEKYVCWKGLVWIEGIDWTREEVNVCMYLCMDLWYFLFIFDVPFSWLTWDDDFMAEGMDIRWFCLA